MVAEGARRRVCPAGHDEGLLKTYLDLELPAAWRESLAAHIPTCGACKDRLAHLRLDGAVVQGRLRLLDPAVAPGARVALSSLDVGASLPRPPAAAVLARARRPDGWRERAASWWRDNAPAAASGRGAAPRWRPAPIAAGIAAGAVLLFGAATTQPAVQSFAQGVLQQFRVQKVQPVQIDLAAMRAARSPVGEQTMEALFRSGTYSGPQGPNLRLATPAEAGRATGLAVRGVGQLPAQVKGGPTVIVSDPMSFTFTYDSQKLAQAIKEAGVTDPALLNQLQTLNGVTVKGDVPAAAAVVYGRAFPEGTPAPGPARAAAREATQGQAPGTTPTVAYIQLKSPSFQVPQNVDVQALRQQVLDVGVKSGAIPPSLATQLLAISDLNTLPIPVAQGQSSQVTVDGVSATLATHDGGGATLTWVKDGALNVLAGNGVSAAELTAAAGSLTALR
jgi:hypothetical protein